MGKVLTKKIGEYIIRYIKYKKAKRKYGGNDIKITKKDISNPECFERRKIMGRKSLRMKKAGAFLTAAAVLTVTVAGCGGDKDGGGKVTWLASSNAEQLKGYQAMMEEFGEDSGLDASVIGMDNGEMYAKMQSLIAANQTPELNSWGTEFVPWAARGAMTPLDDYIEKEGFDTSIFAENMYEALSYDGKQWEFPYSTTTCVLFYNVELFDQAGVEPPTHDWYDESWTTDAFIEMAQKLTLDSEGRNALDPEFDSENIVQYGVGSMQSGAFWPWYFGGDFTDPEVTEYTGDSTETIEGMQFVQDLIHKYHVMPSTEQSEAMAAGGNVFTTGRVAMTIDGSWSCTTMNDADFQWDIAATPIGTQHSIVLFVDGFGIGGDCQNPDGGWEFLKWLYTNEDHYLNFLDVATDYMSIPAITSTVDEVKDILKEKFPGVDIDVLFEAAQHPDAQPVYYRYHENYNEINDVLNQEVIDPITSGDETPEEALTAVKDKMNELIQDK